MTLRCEHDECDHHIVDTPPTPQGWLEVRDEYATRLYCSWNCLMHAAAQVQAPTEI